MRNVLLAATMLVPLNATAAFAVEPDQLVEAMTNAARNAGFAMQVADASKDGKAIVLEGIRYSTLVDGQPAAEPVITFGSLRFRDVTEAEDGLRFAIADAAGVAGTVEPSQPTQPTIEYSIARWGIENGLVPNESVDDTRRSLATYGAVYDRIFVEDVRATFDDTVSVSVAEGEASYDFSQDPLPFSAKVSDALVDLSKALPSADANVREWITSNGHEQIKIDMKLEGTWSGESGTFEVPVYQFDVERMGSLQFEFAADGYTSDVASTMNELMSVPRDANGNRQSPDGAAILGALGGVTIRSGMMRFVDAGLTDSLLDFAAEQMGQPRQTLVSTIAGGAPIAAGAIGASELVGPLYNAVNSFLNEPGSFTISIASKGPVPVTALFAAGATDPKTIPGVIGLAVSANDAP